MIGIPYILSGKKYEGQPRYIMCVGDIENQMPFAMARVLAEAYSPDGLAVSDDVYTSLCQSSQHMPSSCSVECSTYEVEW